jgi:hypothetical protein
VKPNSAGRWWYGLALALALASCGPRDPLDLRVKATTASDYNFWLNDDYGRLSPLVQHDYDEAYRELSLSVMTRQAGLSPDEQKEKVLAAVDGLTVREVIIRGLRLAVDRLKVQRDDNSRLLKDNEHLLATPSTPEQVRTVKMAIGLIQDQLVLQDRDIAAHQARIDLLSRTAGK